MPETHLPKPIRYTTRGFVFRRFTLKERLQILLGYSALIEIHFASQHSPGQCQPVTKINLMPHSNQADALIALRAQVAAEQKANGVVEDSEKEEK